MAEGKMLIEKLIKYAESFLSLNESDVVYKRNELLCVFEIEEPSTTKISAKELEFLSNPSAADILVSEIGAYAREKFGLNDDEVERFVVRVFGLITPLPSVVSKQFKIMRESFSSNAACSYLYNLSVNNYYIKKSAMAKNVVWTHSAVPADLIITINLSKPEKDNKDIAKQLLSSKKETAYPKCPLCYENEGYYGNAFSPARSNLRTVDVELGGESWFMQYSPYGYLNEHCILVKREHVPMKIEKQTADRLFDFIEYLPDYFIGSNASLPIIGGSILTHEHFQGGKAAMPLHKAKPLYDLSSEKYPDVEIAVTDWFSGDIRLSSYNRSTLAQLFGEIVEAWEKYSDSQASIFNDNENEKHNSITVIARFLADGRYSLDLVLRNNSVSEEKPDGVFHVPQKYLNIKKEGIGIMEVLGLFVLPGRLKQEISDICQVLTKKATYEEMEDKLKIHKTLIDDILAQNLEFFDIATAEKHVRKYIGNACVEILKSVAVFKSDEYGTLALKTFLSTIDIK